MDFRPRIPMTCDPSWGRRSESVLVGTLKLAGYAGKTHEFSRANQVRIGCGVRSG
jgi:hypothetical protein